MNTNTELVPVAPANNTPAVYSAEERDFKALAFEVVRSQVELGNKYLGLCRFLRDKMIPKKIGTRWLLDTGFTKSRASEICRVAFHPNALEKLEARAMGWRGALQLSRGVLGELGTVGSRSETDKEMREAVQDIEAELVREEEAAQQESAADTAKSEEEVAAAQKAARHEAFMRCAVRILHIASMDKVKARKWNTGSGYILTLSKAPAEKAVKLPGGKETAAETAAASKK